MVRVDASWSEAGSLAGQMARVSIMKANDAGFFVIIYVKC
jgi:hypothetical protein